MTESSDYENYREELRSRYLSSADSGNGEVGTDGVDHLALISSDLGATIEFYTSVLQMRLTKIVANRDEPTSTHIFLDMGGGNLLAFFDFPKRGDESTVRGIGSMHHVALKATSVRFKALIVRLKNKGIAYSLHGTEERGSVYLQDPDNIQVEVTTGY
ncbi:MAG: VOC family protein [Alphaproteobacteria bacterium]